MPAVGATPEYALNYILEQNGIDPAKDVTIEWKSEHSECVAALNASENAIAMLPQPFVTTAQSKNSNLRVALDLTEEWDKLQENAESPSTLVTGVVVARTEFIEQNPQAVEDFLKHYQESVDYINNNINEGAALVGKYDIV
ncbi:MAG: ABC transporter substrate-binding protein [Acutalibacteraceae bacterium]